MFELLLQADKALAKGKLDQAEKTYWQLIDLDPTNAIALAGLARVAQTRGDESMARTLAAQALNIDPDSIVARHLLEELENRAPAETGPEPPDLPLLAAARLEALSKRRLAEGDVEAKTEAEVGARDGARKAKAEPAKAKAPVPAETAGRQAGRGATAGAKPGAARPGKESRGKTRPDEIEPLPAEPLRDRRQAGRLAAAAAAAAAASREPVRPRHHHAMPVGRRLFGPEGLKSSPPDEFAAAEMAAAVAAVDALDDSYSGLATRAPRVQAARERRAGRLADVLGAVDATEADASVAMRIALLGTAAELEDAERAASQFVHDESVAPTATEVPESAAAGFLNLADAAEAAAAAEAVHEVAGAGAEPEPEPTPKRKHPDQQGPEEPTEEEAEAQAMREAMAIVLQGVGGSAVAPDSARSEAELSEPVAEEPSDESSAGTEQTAQEPSGGGPNSAEPAAETDGRSEPQPRKQGLFRRIRGG